MNREIKFRAWLKKEKKMVQVSRLPLKAKNGKYEDGQSVGWYYTDQASYNDYDIDYSNIEDIELMQYVGLKDKNGKEIFEGDIVNTNIDLMGIVRFDIGYYFEWITNNLVSIWNKDMKVWVEWGLEIIGNIYENPELLEVE